jgi:hypothetical protein
LKARLDALPGVEAAAIAFNLPFGRWISFPYEIEGKTPESGWTPQIGAIIASPDYFPVMSVKPRQGRTFSEADGLAGVPVVVVNQRFAEKIWPGENAIGKRLRVVTDKSERPWLTVVGVVPNIVQNFQRPLEHDPLIYLPFTEEPQREVFIVARTRVPPGALAEAFRHAVQSMDANLPVYDVQSLEDRLAQNRMSVKLLGGMFAVFAAIALVLGTVGLYAVISHSISQRTRRSECGWQLAERAGTFCNLCARRVCGRWRWVWRLGCQPRSGLPMCCSGR